MNVGSVKNVVGIRTLFVLYFNTVAEKFQIENIINALLIVGPRYQSFFFRYSFFRWMIIIAVQAGITRTSNVA